MSSPAQVDVEYMVQATTELCRIPSPTGYTQLVTERLIEMISEHGLTAQATVKGSLVVALPGSQSGDGRLLSAHVDTLGAMVKQIKPNGRLKLTNIGGYDWSTVEGEFCLVHRADGDPVSGTVVTTKSSYHVHGQALVDLKRDAESIEVRLDEVVATADDVRGLGIAVGDFVSYDPKTTVTESGYIKSRHLDDKACAAVCLGVAKAVIDGSLMLDRPALSLLQCFRGSGSRDFGRNSGGSHGCDCCRHGGGRRWPGIRRAGSHGLHQGQQRPISLRTYPPVDRPRGA